MARLKNFTRLRDFHSGHGELSQSEVGPRRLVVHLKGRSVKRVGLIETALAVFDLPLEGDGLGCSGRPSARRVSSFCISSLRRRSASVSGREACPAAP